MGFETRVVFSKDGQMLIHAGPDHVVHVWDVAAARNWRPSRGIAGPSAAWRCPPDGKTLASASADTTALLWDLTRVKRPVPPAKALRPGDLEKCWQALADSDARKAFAAICDLAAAPGDAVVFLKDWLRPAASLDLKRVGRLIGQLDAPNSRCVTWQPGSCFSSTHASCPSSTRRWPPTRRWKPSGGWRISAAS